MCVPCHDFSSSPDPDAGNTTVCARSAGSALRRPRPPFQIGLSPAVSSTTNDTLQRTCQVCSIPRTARSGECSHFLASVDDTWTSTMRTEIFVERQTTWVKACSITYSRRWIHIVESDAEERSEKASMRAGVSRERSEIQGKNDARPWKPVHGGSAVLQRSCAANVGTGETERLEG